MKSNNTVSRSLGYKLLQLLFLILFLLSLSLSFAIISPFPLFTRKYKSSCWVLLVLYPFDNRRWCILFRQSPPSPGNGNCQIGTRQDGWNIPRLVEAHRPYMFRLWAVHVILASPIVYSLLPGPHRVLKKPQRERGEMIAVFLAWWQFFSLAKHTAPSQLLQAQPSHDLEFVL